MEKKFQEPIKENRKPSPFTEYFWNSIENDVFTPIPTTKAEEWVDEYIKVNPITVLSESEIEAIKSCLLRLFTNHIEDINEKTKLLTEGFVYIVTPDIYKSLQKMNCISDRAVYLLTKDDPRFGAMGCKPATKEEKLDYFSEPYFWDDSTFVEIDQGSVNTSQSYFIPGSRSLYQYNYVDAQGFLDHVEEVKNATGKDSLRMLDVGGNLGRALQEAKVVDPTIETFNMTIDEAPSIYGDHIVRHPAELMPAEFEESMDIIESNVAFRYFTYPDIALKNVIKALSIGGAASIDFQADRSSTPKAELMERLNKVFGLVERLEKEGIISIEYGPVPRLHIGYDQIPWYIQTMYSVGRLIKIKKHKSTIGLDF